MRRPPKGFQKANRRRHELIDKEFACGLSAEEEAELREVTQAVEAMLDQFAPLPLDALEKAEAVARRLAADQVELDADTKRALYTNLWELYT